VSAANATKIFGIRVGVDPKILIGVLVAIAALLFWYNTRTDEGDAGAARQRPNTSNQGGEAAMNGKKTLPQRRTGQAANDRGVLRMRGIDATKGDVDPTLHLGLLSRLRAVEEGKIGRSVFEIGPAPQAAATAIKGPKIPVTSINQTPAAAPATIAPQVNIPFKYYGYAKPEEKTEANRGLFLDDADNVMVASEGQTLKGHYMVVELTPNSARIEDTNMRQGKTLNVMALAQQP
jgi:hypothetical protein